MDGFELIELEEELEREYVSIDVDRLVKSKIKQIVVPLPRFLNWQCIDINEKTLRNNDKFKKCLSAKDAKKAKMLNRLSQTHIWNLLDEDFKKKHNFKDFID